MRKNQGWFWTEEWQEREQEADKAIANGELLGPFESIEELVHHLRELRYSNPAPYWRP